MADAANVNAIPAAAEPYDPERVGRIGDRVIGALPDAAAIDALVREVRNQAAKLAGILARVESAGELVVKFRFEKLPILNGEIGIQIPRLQ